MALIRAELWQRRWSLMWWTVAIAFFVGLNLAIYPSFQDQSAELDKALADMPESVRALFTDTGDFLSPVGFLSSQIYYLLLPLLFSILAIGLGASLIAREEQSGTLELLLARPISRTKLLVSKILAGLIVLAIPGFVTLVVAVIGVQLLDFEVSRLAVAVTTVASVLLSLLFGAVAFLFSALGRPARLMSIGIASLLAFGSYLLASLETTVTWLAWPAKALPFHYYQPGEILSGASSGMGQLLGFSIVILLLFIASWIGFRRRDI